jgi:hypothetical protein
VEKNFTTIHLKSEYSALDLVLMSLSRSVSGLCLSVKNAVRSFIQFLGVSSKRIVAVFVETDMEEKEKQSQYPKREMPKVWSDIMSAEERLSDLMNARIAESQLELKPLIITTQNHLESDGSVLHVIGNGTRLTQNTQRFQSLFRKRYAKFIGKEEDWESATPVFIGS